MLPNFYVTDAKLVMLHEKKPEEVNLEVNSGWKWWLWNYHNNPSPGPNKNTNIQYHEQQRKKKNKLISFDVIYVQSQRAFIYFSVLKFDWLI